MPSLHYGPTILMKIAPGFRIAIFFSAAIVTLPSILRAVSPETTIWMTAPAKDFTESSPMGNGRLGAMMFGGVDEERIVLNESSLWSGSPQDADRRDAYKALPEIRKLLLEGKNPEAEALVNANFTCKGPGSGGAQYGCYQVLGNLHLTFQSSTNVPFENYRRELDLNDAVTRMRYQRDDVTYSREMFVSAPDQVMVLHLTADRPKSISFTAQLDRPERFNTEPEGNDGLLMTGQLDNGTDGKGMKYTARVRVKTRGGSVSTGGNKLIVRDADEVLLFIAAATDYRGFAGLQLSDPRGATKKQMRQAFAKPFKTLLEAHVADYRKYFDRVSLHIGPDASTADEPTPERVRAEKENADPNLAALYFNFGRYLLISSSRPGGLPPNLQGIWAEEVHTPWNGDWHLDVNVEMNYWPAEVCNLSDLTDPLFALIASLQKPGEKTAHDYYDARGWVAHVITNPWGFTSPGESASWGASTCGSAWLCQHLYDHYLFTRDKKFLKWAYPILKGSAQFYSDMLIEEPKHRWLVIAPANSPENHFTMPDGRDAAICAGPTMSQQLTRYLFTACIKSSKLLGTDESFRNELIQKRSRLAPTQSGSDGRIMEWLEEYKEPEPQHRHVSHLWGLYPGDEISVEKTPDLAKAARKSLGVRGDNGVGWSLAYRAVLWARLGDGNHAAKLVQKALNLATGKEMRYDGGGGVCPNLFDNCPPFQIDGNFGTTAAIAEMLLQSGDGEIHLLPALPDSWSEGRVTGLCARNGFEISMAWKDGRVTKATIHSSLGEPSRLRYRDQSIELKLKKGQSVTLNANLERVKD